MHDRVNDDKEWALGDLEKMCQLWHISPEQLIAAAPDASVPSAAELAATAAREQAKLEETRRHIAAGLGIAALHDKHKYDGDGDDPA